jgi:cystathionine gamma-synthase
MLEPRDLRPESWAIFGGRDHDEGAALNVPLIPASNFVAGTDRTYARDDGTPTWEALEALVGGLEHGRAVAFASGAAATAAVFDPLPVGSRVAIPGDCYQGTARIADEGARLGRWTVERLDVADTSAWIAAAAEADLLWLETPTNPMLVVGDLPAIAAAARRPGAVLAVDNTFATPLNQQPLLAGADVVVHSVTKYLGGHSDLLTGVAVAAREDLYEALVAARGRAGATPGALEAYLAVRGIRTVGVRLAASEANAAEIARRLDGHRAVEIVRYPGLPSHPTHEVATRVLRGFGSIVSFDVAGGAEAADAVCGGVRLIRHATSLGAVESSMERRGALPGQEHVPPGLLRLSVGCEDVEDLWRDLESALAAGCKIGSGP